MSHVGACQKREERVFYVSNGPKKKTRVEIEGTGK